MRCGNCVDVEIKTNGGPVVVLDHTSESRRRRKVSSLVNAVVVVNVLELVRISGLGWHPKPLRVRARGLAKPCSIAGAQFQPMSAQPASK